MELVRFYAEVENVGAGIDRSHRHRHRFRSLDSVLASPPLVVRQPLQQSV